MLGLLLSRAKTTKYQGIFKSISVCSLCDCGGEDWLRLISGVQNSRKQACAMNTSYSVGVILSKLSYHHSGEKSIVRLWLIFGGWAIAVDLPVIWLITLLSLLRVAIRILGRGFGRALSKAGTYLKKLRIKTDGNIDIY
jgi:hypothetical protein